MAEKDGSVDAIYMNTGNIGSGNVTVGENATLNIDLQCDTDYQTYGIFAKGNVVLNGTVDIKWNIRARVRLTTRGKTYLRMLRTQTARSERMQKSLPYAPEVRARR